MPTERKEKIIEELCQDLSRSTAAIVADYRGLTVSQIGELRSKLRDIGVEFHVAKNTLTARAAQKAGIVGMDPLLEGPTAIAFVTNDVIAPAKALADFARTSKIMTIKGAVLQGRVLNATQVEALATLPPREVLMARVLGGMQGPLVGIVSVLNGTVRSLAYILQARADQLSGQEQQAA